MNLSWRFFPFLGVLVLMGCTIDLPATTAPTPTKSEYDVWNASGTEVRHYDGSDQLQWIERYDADAFKNRRKNHYSAQDKLLWFELSRQENFGTAPATRTTRWGHYLPSTTILPGVPTEFRAWAYDSEGNEVVSASYDATKTLTGYRHNWWEVVATGRRNLQSTQLASTGVASWFDLYTYADNNHPLVADAHAWLNQNLKIGGIETWTMDLTNNVTAEYTNSGGGTTWSRVIHDYNPSTQVKFRQVWSTGEATTGLGTAVKGTSVPSVTPATAKPLSSETGGTSDPLNGITLPDLSPLRSQRVSFPTLSRPSTWTDTQMDYYFTDAKGSTTIRLDGKARPQYLERTETGRSTIRVNFVYDSVGNLIQRALSYGGVPVLDFDLGRDAQGRITSLKVTGSMMKVPLTYSLTYAGTATRPSSLTVSTNDVALFSFDFVYHSSGQGVTFPYGLGALSFDNLIDSLTFNVGGQTDKLPIIQLVFQAPTNVVGSFQDKAVSVYDILGKTEDKKVLKGQLLWTQEVNTGKKTSFRWQTRNSDGSFKTDWSYTAAWGTYAALPAEVESALVARGQSLSAVEAQLSDALGAADSFELDRLFQLADAVKSQASTVQAQYQQMAGNLVDQIRGALP